MQPRRRPRDPGWSHDRPRSRSSRPSTSPSRVRRAMTVAESTARATMFLGAVSAGLVALGLLATATHVGTAFYAFGLILFATLAFVGLVTFERALQSGIEDLGYAHRIAQLRAFYFDNARRTRSASLQRPADQAARHPGTARRGLPELSDRRWHGRDDHRRVGRFDCRAPCRRVVGRIARDRSRHGRGRRRNGSRRHDAMPAQGLADGRSRVLQRRSHDLAGLVANGSPAPGVVFKRGPYGGPAEIRSKHRFLGLSRGVVSEGRRRTLTPRAPALGEFRCP